MRSFDLDHSITVGTTPTLSELRQLALKGYRTVVDLRMPNEIGALSIAEEREAALSARMEFLQISVPARTLPGEQLDIFRRELAALPKPAYVHCTCGGRALLFGAVHLGLEVDEPEDAILTRIQGRDLIDDPTLYDRPIRDYVQRAREPYSRLEQVIW